MLIGKRHCFQNSFNLVLVRYHHCLFPFAKGNLAGIQWSLIFMFNRVWLLTSKVLIWSDLKDKYVLVFYFSLCINLCSVSPIYPSFCSHFPPQPIILYPDKPPFSHPKNELTLPSPACPTKLSLPIQFIQLIISLLPPFPTFTLFFHFLFVPFRHLHPLTLCSTLTSSPCLSPPTLDPLLWAMVPGKDPGPGPSLGGAGETSQEAAGQVRKRATALLRSHVLRAQCFPTGARSHQVKSVSKQHL